MINKFRKSLSFMIAVIFIFSFSWTALANAGMGGESAFSKWMKISKGGHEENGRKSDMKMKKKMKKMITMKFGMKSMVDMVGIFDEMGDGTGMSFSDSAGMNKMTKAKKSDMNGFKMNIINGSGSMIKKEMGLRMKKEMPAKMKKRMRKKMGGAMSTEPAMNIKEDMNNQNMGDEASGGMQEDISGDMDGGNTGAGADAQDEPMGGTE